MSPFTYLNDPSSHNQAVTAALIALEVYDIGTGHGDRRFWHIALTSDRTVHMFADSLLKRDPKDYSKIPGISSVSFFTSRRALKKYRQEQAFASQRDWKKLDAAQIG